MEVIFFSDEAWFLLSGYVNSQNSRVWSAENPHTILESPLHDVKVGAWCAISHKWITGPIYIYIFSTRRSTLNTIVT